MLTARWVPVEGWASQEAELRRVAVKGERHHEPVGLVIGPWPRPLRVQCGDASCGAEFGRAWVGARAVTIRPGFVQDMVTGLWRLSSYAERERRRAARAGISWAEFELPARRVARAPSKKLPSARPDLAPAADVPLPLGLVCPLCRTANELVAPSP